MKVIYQRCPICLSWRRPETHKHCHYCGAYEVKGKGVKRHFINRQGTEIVRSGGIPFEQMISAR